MQSLLIAPRELAPSNRVEEFFFSLYRNMNAFPKRNPNRLKQKQGKFDKERQWVFVGSKEKMKSMATHSTLFAAVGDPDFDSTFYTPNGYYRRDQRLTESLRWLNAFVLDLDVKGDSIIDVLERIQDAGLPKPTAVIKTPSGGHHVAFFFKDSVRATPRSIRLYSAIMGHMSVDIGGDPAAVGANRIFRTPTEDSLVYFNPEHKYDFDVFKNWRDINHPYQYEQSHAVTIHTGDDLMKEPALLYLLESPCKEGKREQTAFTLSLAMKASGWSQGDAETAIQEWFTLSCAKGAQPGKDPFTIRDAVYKVRYVYHKTSLHAPSASVIRELTGMPFYYKCKMVWKGPKPRSKRERTHLYEWKQDFLLLINKRGELVGTQQEIANLLNCPLASLKEILKQLKEEGQIVVETKKGRGGFTTIRLPETPDRDKKKYSNVILFNSKRFELQNQHEKKNEEMDLNEIVNTASDRGKFEPRGPD